VVGLHLTIVLHTSVRDFDNEINVFWARVPILRHLWVVQHDIGLRRTVRVELNGTLDANTGRRRIVCIQPTREQLEEVVNAVAVGGTNRGHVDEAAIEKFDAVVFAEDAGPAHGEVLLDGDAPLAEVELGDRRYIDR
jgi:hypothetical protein